MVPKMFYETNFYEINKAELFTPVNWFKITIK